MTIPRQTDLASLRTSLASSWHARRSDVTALVSAEYEALRQATPAWTSIGWFAVLYIGGLIVLWWWQMHRGGSWFALGVLIGLLGVTWFVRRWWLARQQFQMAVNEALYGVVGYALGVPLEHRHNLTLQRSWFGGMKIVPRTTERTAIVADLERSALLTETITEHAVDDSVTIMMADRQVTVHELRLTRVEQRGKESVETELFLGLFAHITLKKSLTGRTYISTNGDRTGFAHRTFWSRIIGNEVKETVLESNEFERDLHVATTDPIEARYILTPAFMYDVHEWWKEHRENIRLAFQGQDCFILLPDAHLPLQTGPSSLDDARVLAHLEVIARPIWRVLQLVHDMRV